MKLELQETKFNKDLFLFESAFETLVEKKSKKTLRKNYQVITKDSKFKIQFINVGFQIDYYTIHIFNNLTNQKIFSSEYDDLFRNSVIYFEHLACFVFFKHSDGYNYRFQDLDFIFIYFEELESEFYTNKMEVISLTNNSYPYSSDLGILYKQSEGFIYHDRHNGQIYFIDIRNYSYQALGNEKEDYNFRDYDKKIYPYVNADKFIMLDQTSTPKLFIITCENEILWSYELKPSLLKMYSETSEWDELYYDSKNNKCYLALLENKGNAFKRYAIESENNYLKWYSLDLNHIKL